MKLSAGLAHIVHTLVETQVAGGEGVSSEGMKSVHAQNRVLKKLLTLQKISYDRARKLGHHVCVKVTLLLKT